jgi:two-component system response regulator HupR/HoxA
VRARLLADGLCDRVHRGYSAAAVGLTFDGLAEVAVARDLLRRWFGLELGLTEPDGGGEIRTSHVTCDTIHGATGQSCGVVLRELAASHAKTRRTDLKTAVIKRSHPGVVMVAAPVFGDAGLVGIVYASGAGVPDNTELASGLAALGFSPEEVAAQQSAVPTLSDADLARVQDLVVIAASAVERAQPAVIPPTTHIHPFNEIVGDAPAVRDVVKLLTKVVRSEATVLIHGESGTGKELIARAIHYHGPRAKKPFVVQNCSAFNDNLLESALFGHVRGAFTGAVKDQPGLFQTADGGTFFLDEIGDMSAALQVKLLRVLQESTFTPVGGTKPVKVDVRIIAASHKDLAAMVQHKQFREDLFYRVNVLKLTVPPLRERVADIPRLAAHFIKKHWRSTVPAPRLSQGALARLVAYPWPGNIRELENEMERMLVLAGDATELTASMVSGRVSGIVGAAQSAPRSLRDSLANAEADALVASLGRHTGDRDAVAAELGTSRPYLDARMAALGLGTPG